MTTEPEQITHNMLDLDESDRKLLDRLIPSGLVISIGSICAGSYQIIRGEDPGLELILLGAATAGLTNSLKVLRD